MSRDPEAAQASAPDWDPGFAAPLLDEGAAGPPRGRVRRILSQACRAGLLCVNRLAALLQSLLRSCTPWTEEPTEFQRELVATETRARFRDVVEDAERLRPASGWRGQAGTRFVLAHLYGSPAELDQFNDVLANETVREMVGASFLVWTGDATDVQGEAAQLSRTFGILELPTTLVLRPQTGVPLRDLEIPVQVHGALGVDRLVGVLMVALDSEERERRAQRRAAPTPEQESAHLLMQEQDREFEEAAAIDRAKEEQRQREAQAAQKAEAEAEAAAAAEEAQALAAKEEVAQRRRAAAAEFEQRPPAEGARLQVRFPCGARVTQSFAPDATLAVVAGWVDCCAYLGSTQAGLEVPERFELATAFPSRQLELASHGDQTLEGLGLCPSSVLLVHDLDS